MNNVDFTEETQLTNFVDRRRVDSTSTLFKMILKSGLVHNVDHIYYLCLFVSIFFFMLSAVIVATAL